MRKGVNKKLRHGYPTHRDAIWAAIRTEKEFDCKHLWAVINKTAVQGTIKNAKEASLSSIRSYLVGLNIAGYLKKEESKKLCANNRTGTFHYRLIKDVGIDAPRVTNDGKLITEGQTFENMWKAMKILKTFNWMELHAHASLKEVPIKNNEAQNYVRDLYNAGYLVRTEKIRGIPPRYKLLPSKYTGPKPPMRQRVTQVYDANLGKVVWPVEGEQ